MSAGTYTLAIELPERTAVSVGALGDCEFRAGWYAYTGSALGPGGFARVDRHHRTATGAHDTRHWHVDYLLGDTSASIHAVSVSRGVDVECPVARAVAATLDAAGISDPPIDGFGASDCDCSTHLHYAPDRPTLIAAVRGAHREHVGQ